jgi:hypothetical protein
VQVAASACRQSPITVARGLLHSTLRVQSVRSDDISAAAAVFASVRARSCCIAQNFALTVIVSVNMIIFTV